MVRQLRAIKDGTTPEKALAIERAKNSSPNEVLVNTLTDLFSFVSQRNQALKAVNMELVLAKSELARANEQLEARVPKERLNSPRRMKSSNVSAGR